MTDILALYHQGEPVEVATRMPKHNPKRDYVFLMSISVTLPDIIMYQSTLIQGGVLEFPPEGVRVDCIVKKHEKGPRAEKVLRVLRGGAIPVKISAVQELGPEVMVVKFFDTTRGYGFFTRGDGVDVFIHYTVVDACGLKWTALIPGTEMMVSYKPSETGFKSTRIELRK